MAWIKRNLFFVIGGILSLGLLGGASFFIYQGWSKNSQASTKLNEIYTDLQTVSQQSPAPGNDKIDNTAIAKEQEKQVRAWINSVNKYFSPIPPVPGASTVTSEAFAAALRRTIEQLQHEADNAGVALPPKYDFSFAAERTLVRFAPGSLAPLAAQLGEIKAISEILFATRINALDGIQRVRVSDDDAAGPQSDYVEERPTTNDMSVVIPFVITFRSFTPELARVMTSFATASNTFIIKAINVQPAGSAIMPTASTPMAEGEPGLTRMPREGMPTTVPGRGGLQTVLKEQLLRVTIQLDLVKLLPKS